MNHQSLCNLQQEKENNPTDLENLHPQTCLKKAGGCDGFRETSRNLEIFFIKVQNFQKLNEELARKNLLLCL